MTLLEAQNILGVDSLNEEAIKKAYRQKAMSHHPDIVGDGGNSMALINEAKSLLMSAVKQGYNGYLHHISIMKFV